MSGGLAATTARSPCWSRPARRSPSGKRRSFWCSSHYRYRDFAGRTSQVRLFFVRSVRLQPDPPRRQPFFTSHNRGSRRRGPALGRRPAPAFALRASARKPPVGKSAGPHTLTPPPRLVPNPSICHRGMHRHCWLAGHGSRRPNSRRGIGPTNFRLRRVSPGSERPPAEGRFATAWQFTAG